MPLPPPTLNGADFLRETVAQGAKALINEADFPLAKEGTTYLAPQVLVNVDHSNRVMMEESFGPVVGIMKVRSLPALALPPALWLRSVVGLRAVLMPEAGQGRRRGAQAHQRLAVRTYCKRVDEGRGSVREAR